MFRRLVLWTLPALAAQFLLGMAVNLFAAIPPEHPGTRAGFFAGVPQVVAWALGHGAVTLRLHVALGLALCLEGAVVLVLAVRSRRRGWIWMAAVGLCGLLGALANGASYLIFGHQFSSFLMAVAFAIAAAAYVTGALVPGGA